MVKTLLVIECTPYYNWYKIFEGARLHSEEPIVVEQAEWQDISTVSYGREGVQVSLRRANRPLPGTPQNKDRHIKIDFLLLRSVSRGVWTQDSRNMFFSLMHGNIPSVNSLESAYLCMERPVTYGALLSIQQRLGKENFPLIQQYFFPSYKEMLFTPEYPLVVKLGYAHSGYGKMKLHDPGDYRDFGGVVALTPHYVTAEPFIDWDWDGRIQKIGSHYRAFKRTSPIWKGNVGNMSLVHSIEVTPQFKQWADLCASLLGGLDILGLDFVHSKVDDKYYILELNDTAIGLVHEHEEEDMQHMRDLVILRMQEKFSKEGNPRADPVTENVEAIAEKLKLLEIQIKREQQNQQQLEKKLAETEKALESKTPFLANNMYLLGFVGLVGLFVLSLLFQLFLST